MKLSSCYLEHLDTLRLRHEKWLLSWVGYRRADQAPFRSQQRPEQDSQCTHNVIRGSVRATIVVVEKQYLHDFFYNYDKIFIMSVCL
jgi:hypothetical protein